MLAVPHWHSIGFPTLASMTDAKSMFRARKILQTRGSSPVRLPKYLAICEHRLVARGGFEPAPLTIRFRGNAHLY
jgi:hypothetical protein